MRIVRRLPLLVLLAALGPLHAQDAASQRLKEMIERLGASEVAIRDKAQKEIQGGWEKWSEADLAEIEKARRNPDPEIAVRAKEALRFIVCLRSFATHVLVKIDKSGTTRINGEPVAQAKGAEKGTPLANAFGTYAHPPKDPTGKKIFTGLRAFLDVDKEASFLRVYEAIAAAQRSTPLSEVVLVDPSRSVESTDEPKLVLFLLRGKEAGQDADWKERFLTEVHYHYQTQQMKHAQIEELTKTVEELRQKVASLEQQLKERK